MQCNGRSGFGGWGLHAPNHPHVGQISLEISQFYLKEAVKKQEIYNYAAMSLLSFLCQGGFHVNSTPKICQY
jgi:hypothetical protein